MQILPYIKAIFLLCVVFCLPSFGASPVTDEEYKVYSSFINQVYLAPSNDWFSIRGDKIENTYNPKIEQVVIGNLTVGINLEIIFSKENLSLFPKNLLSDYPEKNTESQKLVDKFKTNVPHSIWLQNNEEQLSIIAEAERLKVDWTTLFHKRFFEKFPKARGYLFFSRVVFDSAHKNAFVAVGRTDIYPKNQNAGGQRTRITLFRKIRGKWLLKTILPKENILKVDSKQCRQQNLYFGFGLGSMSIGINGLNNGKCILTDSLEIEGSSTTTKCLIPTSIEKIFIVPAFSSSDYGFYFSKDVSGFCEKPETGSHFFNQK